MEERSHLEEQDVAGRIILKWMLEKLDGRAWTGLIWLRIEINGEDGNAFMVSTRRREFLD